jgi:hypothetical protein
MFTGHGWPARPPGQVWAFLAVSFRRGLERGGGVLTEVASCRLRPVLERERLCVAVAVMAQQGSRPLEWCMGLLLSPGAGLGPRGGHVPVAVYGATVEFVGFTCPPPPLENYLRPPAGETSTGAVSPRITWSGSSIRLASPGGCRTASASLVLVIMIGGYGGAVRHYRRGRVGGPPVLRISLILGVLRAACRAGSRRIWAAGLVSSAGHQATRTWLRLTPVTGPGA